jgi:hypothetical protein
MLANATDDRRTSFAVASGSLGLALVLVGAVAPWLSLFRGLEPVPGLLLDGGPLAGIAVAVVGLLVAASGPSAARPPFVSLARPVAALGALVVGADALWSYSRMTAFAASPGPAGALLAPSVGPGSLLMAAGAATLGIAAVAARQDDGRTDVRSVARFGVVMTLFVAGWAHLLLAPAHLSEAPTLGVAFIVAAIVQLGLAGAILLRPDDRPLVAAIAVNTVAIVVYLLAVTVGLPGHEHAATAARSLVPEAIDATGVVTKAAEAAAIVLAFGLLGRRTAAR